MRTALLRGVCKIIKRIKNNVIFPIYHLFTTNINSKRMRRRIYITNTPSDRNTLMLVGGIELMLEVTVSSWTFALTTAAPEAGTLTMAYVVGQFGDLNTVATVQTRRSAAGVTGATLYKHESMRFDKNTFHDARTQIAQMLMSYLERILALFTGRVSEFGATSVSASASAIVDATAVLRLVQFACVRDDGKDHCGCEYNRIFIDILTLDAWIKS